MPTPFLQCFRGQRRLDRNPPARPVVPSAIYIRKIFIQSMPLLISATFLCAFACNSNEVSDVSGNTHTPILIKGSKSEIDFGYVPLNTQRSGCFMLSNPETQDLHILKILSNCTCLQASVDSQLIPPGQKCAIQVQFSAPHKAEDYRGTILLKTDSPTQNTIQLQIHAGVGQPLEVQPNNVDLGTLSPNATQKGVLTIFNHGDRPFRPIYAATTHPSCIISVPASDIPPHQCLELPFVFTAEDHPEPQKLISVTIPTNCETQPTLTATISYRIHEPGSPQPVIPVRE